MIHRLISLFLVLLVLMGAQGCSDKDPSVIRFGLASAPLSLDPRYTTDAVSSRLNRLLYQRLVDFDQNQRAVPSLASWKKISPTLYRFTLKPGANRFVTGQSVTSFDVKATYDFILDKKNASPHRGSLKIIQRIQALNPVEVEFQLQKADPLFPSYLVIGILPQKQILSGKKFDRNPQGSGDFEFVSWPEDGLVRLRRKKDQKLFEFIHVPDATVRVLKLLRGEIDLLQNDLPRELVRYLKKKPKIVLQNRQGSNFTYLGFNYQDKVLSRPEVRRAIAHAIDRKSIIKHLFGGDTRTADAMFPPEHWVGNPEIRGIRYNPELARSFLKQLGYTKETPLVLSYKTSSDPFRIRVATVIQQQLSEVGIKVNLQSYDWATFYGDIKNGRFQLYSLSWVGVKSPDIFRYVFHSKSVPPNGANRGRYHSKMADYLIEQAEKAQSLEEQVNFYQDLQQHLQDTLPYVPLWYEEHFYAARNTISGYRLAGDGNYDGVKYVQKSN